MSSGMPRDLDASSQAIAAIAPSIISSEYAADLQRKALSPRQKHLDWLYRWYDCTIYDGYKTDWRGKKAMSSTEHDIIVQQGYIPPGFYDAGQSTPLKFRKPSTPSHIVRLVVDRLTGMTFSERANPSISIAEDADTEDSTRALCEAGQLWSYMAESRNLGGAMGGVAIGFKFVEGSISFEVFDPRWTFVQFIPGSQLDVARVDKRVIYMQEDQDPLTGQWVTTPVWQRRVIDETHDTLYAPALVVTDGTPIDWQVESTVAHGLGFCPVVWIQNRKKTDTTDGDPDAHGVYDRVDEMDRLNSQAHKGTINNCFGQETKFITDKGVRRLADFRHGDTTCVLTHTGAWKSAVVRNYGDQQLYAITMQRGGQGAPVVVRATRDHRWLLADGTETEHLEVGDRLLSAPAKFSDFEYETATVEERAYWCKGFIWGDGSRYGAVGSHARLCGAKTAYLGRFLENGFNLHEPAYLAGTGDVLVTSKEIGKGLPSADGTSLNLLRAFARGYVDADGSKSRKGSSRWHRIQATGEASIKFIRQVFPAVGLYISHEVDMTGTSTNYGVRTAQTVRFALNENASTYFNSLWRVTAVEPLGVEPVWCLSTEDDRSIVLPEGIATGQCDPTVKVIADAPMAEIMKGSENAVQAPLGSAIDYMEMGGAGIERAQEIYKNDRQEILDQCSVVLPEQVTGSSMTATEINRRYSSMVVCVGKLREQYGQAVVKLIKLILKAVAVHGPNSTIKLPPKIERDEDTGEVTVIPRKFGRLDVTPTLVWPPHFEPSPQDTLAATQATGLAVTAGTLQKDKGIEFLAPYFRVDDVAGMVSKLRKEAASKAQQMPYGPGQGTPGAAFGQPATSALGLTAPRAPRAASTLAKAMQAPGGVAGEERRAGSDQ